MSVGRRSKAVVTAVLSVSAAVLLPGAAGAGPRPLVRSASLSQQGPDLAWSVQLSRPFSAAALGRQGGSLCLLIERASSGAPQERVCVAPGRHRRPRIVLGHRAIAATVSRHRDRLTATFLVQTIGLGYHTLRWQTAITCAQSPCSPAIPARPRLLKLRVPRLIGCRATGPSWITHGPTRRREIALTFDDGPWGDPPSIDFVNELARLHVPGTFFVIGEEIGNYDPRGAVQRAMLAHGDMIGNHTWSHPDMVGLGAAAQRSQLTMTAAAIKRATGFRPCLFRSPYGDANPGLLAVARSLGMTTIQWDIDPRDWATPGTGAIESTIFSEATNGGIVEEHFGGGPRYETLDSLPDVVRTLRRRGYRFVTLTQMLGYRLIYR